MSLFRSRLAQIRNDPPKSKKIYQFKLRLAQMLLIGGAEGVISEADFRCARVRLLSRFEKCQGEMPETDLRGAKVRDF